MSRVCAGRNQKPIVEARKFIRKLRGGTQAHLIECSDGRYYAVKFRNNPQGRRVLVNEWLAHVALTHLRIASPEKAIVHVSDDFLLTNVELVVEKAAGVVRLEAGFHFGTAFPGDPEVVGMYDYLPDQILETVANRHDFWGALVVDRWMANADRRQCIFVRARVRKWAPSVPAHGSRTGFVAIMIDNGLAFNGSLWSYNDSLPGLLYPKQCVYKDVRGLDSFQPWLEQVEYFPERLFVAARREIPESWVSSDWDDLDRLIEGLLRRREIITQLVLRSHRLNRSAFPAWR